MARPKKNEGVADIGHNRPGDEARVQYTKHYMELQDKIDLIKGQQKDVLNEAKASGHLKGAIKKAAKILGMTAEQNQARKEVEHETQHIVQLFVNDDSGQYSFLRDDEAA